jgi:hypothetical protein
LLTERGFPSAAAVVTVDAREVNPVVELLIDDERA